MLGWLLIVALFGSVLIGYIAFATFIIAQMLWIAGIVTAIYLISVIIEEGAETLLQPNTAVGRGLTSMVGLGREALEQIAVLIEGAVARRADRRGDLARSGALGHPVAGHVRQSARRLFRLSGRQRQGFRLLDARRRRRLHHRRLITRAVQGWLASRCCRAPGSTRACAIRSRRFSAMSASSARWCSAAPNWA